MGDTLDSNHDDALEALEIRLLLDGIYEYYGYDFRDYAPSTLKRRVRESLRREKLANISGLLEKVLHDAECMHRLAGNITITVSTMFRDPDFFAKIGSEVIPWLQTYPFIRIWHAGCGRGEEVYSMAILLHEAGLYDRCRIYATDLNDVALRQAQAGVFPLDKVQEYTRNYIAASNRRSFSEYYTARYGNAIFRPWLKKHMIFSRHNLATDGPFNEFNLILCRNVLIYFNQSLQERVHDMLYNSLTMFGFLGLGWQESLRATAQANYEVFSGREKIFRKIQYDTA
jgi:chemotaxis protein methyltransferase CheR